jgi:5'-deoxynucleotidase YfbR-like HD superfamily hydrolase
MSTIKTRTGRLIDVMHPQPTDFRLADIGHSLALTNRFGGHTFEPYSVAQHSVLMGLIVPKEDKLWALFHDAMEAYVGDLPKPIKRVLPQFADLEDRLMSRIAGAFHLSYPVPESVKEADVRMMLTEARDLLEGGLEGFDAWAEGFEPYDFPIYPWSWQEAKTIWLHHVREELKIRGY